MALLFFDNFGGYVKADITKYWADFLVSSHGSLSATGGRNNGPYLNTTTNGQLQAVYVKSKVFTSSSTFVVGFAVYLDTTNYGVSAFNIIHVVDSDTVQMSLNIDATGKLNVFSGTSTVVTGGQSVLNLSTNAWYYIEMKVTIADSISAGTCEVRVNGVTWITVATGQDLKSSANTTGNQIFVGKVTSTNTESRITDIYIDNGTTFLGDCTVSTLTVSGAGTTNTLTTGTFADVDDATPDSDSTYAESAVNGQLATFAISNLVGTPVTIHAVSPWSLIRKTDGGTKTARTVIRSGGTDYGQTDFNATDSYLYNAPITTVDPATGVAWVAAGVNAIEVGFEVRS